MVERLLGDDKPNLMVTDPPYGVEYTPEWRNELLEGDRRNTAQVENDNEWEWSNALSLFLANVFYVWHSMFFAGHIQALLEDIGCAIRSQIIWVKHVVISQGHYHCSHESCWYAVRKGATASWNGSRTASTVWEAGLDLNDKTIHSTQKPIAVMSPPIKNHTIKGDAVYDPFLGSGTTLIAAHQLERICYGVEIKPEFVDIIIARFQRHSDDEIACERGGKSRKIDEFIAQ